MVFLCKKDQMRLLFMKNKLDFSLSVIFLIGFLFILCSPIIAEQKFPFVAKVTAKGVNVRAGQSKNFEKLAELKQGEEVVVVEKSYSWYKIKLPVFAKSYISKDYVKVLGGGIGRIMGNRVNIRGGADVRYSVIGQVKKDEWVKVLGTKGDWFQIEPLDDSYGYVADGFLKFSSWNIPPARVVPPPTKNIYELKRRQEAEELRKEALAEREKAQDEPSKPVKKPIVRYKMVGVVEALGQEALSNDIRHRLVVGGQTKCFLKGYRSILDSFLNQRVMIEGEFQKEVEAPLPVMLVTKINLIL